MQSTASPQARSIAGIGCPDDAWFSSKISTSSSRSRISSTSVPAYTHNKEPFDVEPTTPTGPAFMLLIHKLNGGPYPAGTAHVTEVPSDDWN